MYGKPLSEYRLQKLSQLCWDMKIDAVQLDELLQGKVAQVGTLTRQRLFQRMAESYSWYTILNLLTASELKFLLQNEVISGLRSASLKENYFYARQRLQGTL